MTATRSDQSYRSGMAYAMLIGLVAGMGLGTANLVHLLDGQWEAVSIQLHGHLQLLGFVGLFIVGVGSHAIPRFAGTAVASPRLLAAAAPTLFLGLLLRVPGQIWTRGGALWVLSAVLELTGLLLFSGVMLQTLWSTRTKSIFVSFVQSSLAWACGSSLATLGLTLVAVSSGQHLLGYAADQAILLSELLGFAGLMILAFATHALPRFVASPAAPDGPCRLALWLLNLSLLGLTVAPAAARPVAAALWLVGAVVMVWTLRVFAPSSRTLETAGKAFQFFVRASFAWLLLGSALQLWGALATQSIWASSATRHALALGFVTTMIYGFALRILSVFTPAGHAPRLLLGLVFWSQLGGTFLRLVHGLADAWIPDAVPLAGAGLNVFAFLTFFATVIVLVSGTRKSVAVPVSYPISADMKVGPVLERFPATLPVLVARGFTLLENPQVREEMGNRVTLRQASRIMNVDADRLVDAVNDAIRIFLSPN